MAVEWMKVDKKVMDMADRLIDSYHPDLKHAMLGIIFRSESSKSGNKIVIGKASKANNMWNALYGGELDFVIWLAHDWWEGASPQKRRALLDHELCHCRQVGGEWKLVGHDIEEFNCIIERHGYWNDDLAETGLVMKQVELPVESFSNFIGELVTFGGDYE